MRRLLSPLRFSSGPDASWLSCVCPSPLPIRTELCQAVQMQVGFRVCVPLLYQSALRFVKRSRCKLAFVCVSLSFTNPHFAFQAVQMQVGFRVCVPLLYQSALSFVKRSRCKLDFVCVSLSLPTPHCALSSGLIGLSRPLADYYWNLADFYWTIIGISRNLIGVLLASRGLLLDSYWTLAASRGLLLDS
jgi:hypothetical protein